MPLPAVLIANDHPVEVPAVRQHLEKAGIKNPLVTFRDAEDLKEFLNSARGALRPCLVLLDLNLPKSQGFDTLRWIRERDGLKDVPVVILAGAVEPKDVKRAASLGVTRVVTKHPSPRVLAEIIASEAAEA